MISGLRRVAAACSAWGSDTQKGVIVLPSDGNAVVASESLDPVLIISGPLGQSLLGDGVDAVHVAEEMDDMLGASQQRRAPGKAEG